MLVECCGSPLCLTQLALSFPLSLVAFAAGIYLGGFARALRPVYAMLLPLAMLAAGRKRTALKDMRPRPS